MVRKGWFYYCFEWYIQPQVRYISKQMSWFYYCFEWYIQQLDYVSGGSIVGFIIVLNGISNYKVACDDVRMGVDNRGWI